MSAQDTDNQAGGASPAVLDNTTVGTTLGNDTSGTGVVGAGVDANESAGQAVNNATTAQAGTVTTDPLPGADAPAVAGQQSAVSGSVVAGTAITGTTSVDEGSKPVTVTLHHDLLHEIIGNAVKDAGKAENFTVEEFDTFVAFIKKEFNKVA